MDFSKLKSEELQEFFRYFNVPYTENMVQEAADLFSQVQSTYGASATYPAPVIDLYLAQQFIDRGGHISQKYSEETILNLSSEDFLKFAQILNLPLEDQPEVRSRLIRILRILNALSSSYRLPTNSLIEFWNLPGKTSPEKIGQGIYVINDGKIYPYGTKQRISSQYVADKMQEGCQEFIYCGPSTAMGAYALAWGCVQNNVRCTLFLVGPEIPPQGQDFPNSVQMHLLHMSLKDAEERCQQYVQEDPSRCLVPFGLNDPLYRELLKNSFLTDPLLQPLRDNFPAKIWLAAGSGMILSVLLELFPYTSFGVVQVGKRVWLDNLTSDPQTLENYRKRITFYQAPERFTHPAEIPPPYSSLDNYDAKVWRFVLQDGQLGDVIWNVARSYPKPYVPSSKSTQMFRGRRRGRR